MQVLWGWFSDAIGGVELALADYRAMFRNPLVDDCQVDKETAELLPDMTIVTDSGGPSRSLSFELIIQRYPELGYVCTRVKSPGQRGKGARVRDAEVRAAVLR